MGRLSASQDARCIPDCHEDLESGRDLRSNPFENTMTFLVFRVKVLVELSYLDFKTAVPPQGETTRRYGMHR